jgi:hypothetical protein
MEISATSGSTPESVSPKFPVYPVTEVPGCYKGTTNMEILREKIKADKKLVVAANLDLTEAEAMDSGPSTMPTRIERPEAHQRAAG